MSMAVVVLIGVTFIVIFAGSTQMSLEEADFASTFRRVQIIVTIAVGRITSTSTRCIHVGSIFVCSGRVGGFRTRVNTISHHIAITGAAESWRKIQASSIHMARVSTALILIGT
jgi:hypothetical protein